MACAISWAMAAAPVLKSLFLSLIGALLLLGPLTEAQEGEACVQQVDNYEDLLIGSWAVECSKPEYPPEVQDFAFEFLRTTVMNGLKTLCRINPELVEKGLDRVRHRSLVITCEESPFPGYASTRYAVIPLIADRFQFGRTFRYLAGKMKTPLAEQDLASERMHRNILFHEYLHHMRLDNISIKAHLEMKTSERTSDTVYSCASQAYPTVLKRLDEASDAAVVANTVEACLACASSRIEGGLVTMIVAESNSDELRRRCLGFVNFEKSL